MSKNPNTGRFVVGQQIHIVSFLVVTPSQGKSPDLRYKAEVPPYWAKQSYGVMVRGLELKILTVTEHHKVAWDQDPSGEKKYDGYILKDEDGNVYYNQYPQAVYGQISDRHDRLFMPANLENGNRMWASVTGVMDDISGINELPDLIHKHNELLMEKNTGSLNTAVVQYLQQHQSQILIAFANKYKGKYALKPITWREGTDTEGNPYQIKVWKIS